MAFFFDSPAGIVLAPLALFLAAAWAWRLTRSARAITRIHVRFAAILLTALAAAVLLGWVTADGMALAFAVAPIAASLAVTALSLALLACLARPLPQAAAAVALSLSLAAGIAAALAAQPAYGFGCQLVGVSLTLAAALPRLLTAPRFGALALLVCLSLLCAGLCLMDGALGLAQLFFALALLGAARASQTFKLQARIEPQRQGMRLAAISGRG